MRIAIMLPALALVAASCGPKTLALPDDPIDKAATCGVVAAANARKMSPAAVAGPLAFEQQGRVLHYALLAGAVTPQYEQDKAAAVVKRMPEIEAPITGGKWDTLIAPCKSAFPEAAASDAPPALPEDSRLGCFVLEGFLEGALKSEDAAYGKQLAAYMAMRRKLEPKIGASLLSKGDSGVDAQGQVKAEAMSRIVKVGSPMAVMKACLVKFG